MYFFPFEFLFQNYQILVINSNYAFNIDVGNYLTKHFYSDGEYYNWNDRLIHGTGKPLDIKAYLDFYQIK